MRNSGNKKGILYDVFIILGIAFVLSWMCRLWPVILLLMFIALGIGFYKLVRKYSKTIDEAMYVEPEMEDLTDVEVDDGYSMMVGRITAIVQEQYPNAKWVWEKTNTQELIKANQDVFILLNQAGGYRKARVQVRDYQVEEVEFLSVKPKDKPQENAVDTEVETAEKGDEKKNYELLAYEWVADRIMLLNERCNEAIGRGDKELILTEDELPQEKESWADICRELERAELKNVELISQGIKIKLSVEETEKE